MVRRILTYHLIALLFVTNIGIPVFTHSCRSQAKSWSSIFVPAKSCCNKKKNATESKPCHSSKSDESTGIKNTPCCENHSSIAKLGTHFIKFHIGTATKIQTYCPGPAFSFYTILSDTFQSIGNADNKPHGPPLILYGRSLLISEQVFRC